MKELKELFVETVTERLGEHVLASTIRPATAMDVAVAIRLHSEGKCPHNVVEDTPGWMYDFRACAICGTGLGVV